MIELRWFNKLYSTDFLHRLAKRGGSDPVGVIYYLTSASEAAEIRRIEMDKYLEVAYRHDAMTRDRLRRLRSGKWEVFIQALQEIKAAWYFEQKLQFVIRFNPSGRDTRIGEFELIRQSAPPIFVEVKSPIRERSARVWLGNDAKAIRANVKSALGQLPKDRPGIVVLSGLLRTPVSDPHSGVIDALYGTTVVEVPLGGDPRKAARVTLKPNGLYQPNSSTRISAVATLQDVIYSPYYDTLLAHILSEGKVEVDESLPHDVLKYDFKVYHNPFAKYPLHRKTFGPVKQFAPDSRGYMRWYPQVP